MQIADSWFRFVFKPIVFSLACLPALLLGIGLIQDNLGANPVEVLIRSSGDWALRFLLLSLLISPLRRLLGWAQLIRVRRMVGLFAFAYASAHMSLYLWLEQDWLWREIIQDVVKRPFMTAGMLAFLLLLPLALSSTQGMMRRLGRHWKTLHRLVYPASLLVILHFWWMKDSKADTSEPLIYAVLLAVLLGERLVRAWSKA